MPSTECSTTHSGERKRISPLPCLLPYGREVRRAVAGDVPGVRTLKPLSFPNRPQARRRLLFGMSSFYAKAPFTTAEERIQFARKLAVHIIRDNWRRVGTDIRLGVEWFADNRTALPSRLSFSGAIRLQKAKDKHALEQQILLANTYWHADMHAPDVPVPVIFSHGEYHLGQLTTARHLLDTGIEAGNCLAQRMGKACVPNVVYWTQLRDGTRHIFTLRRAGVLLVVFSIAPPYLTEMHYLTRGKDIVDVVKRCIPAIETVSSRVPVSFHRLLDNGQADHGPSHQCLVLPPASTNDNAPVRP
jgi:hypothetical protein